MDPLRIAALYDPRYTTVVKKLISRDSVQTDRWLVRSSKTKPTIRLICFPYAGAGASVFRAWQTLLPREVEVSAVQYPGREWRSNESPATDMSALVRDFVPALLPHLAVPFAFFGHSAGAIIAFEVARALQNLRRQPMHLFVGGCRAPHIPDPDPPLHNLATPDFLRAIVKLNGTPAELFASQHFIDFWVPIMRADTQLIETYKYEPGPPLECPITAFAGKDDDKATASMALAWGQLTTGRFRDVSLPGDHFFLNSERPALLADIGATLMPKLGHPEDETRARRCTQA